MKKTIALTVALFFCLLGYQVQADEFRVNGTVTFTSANIPIPGVELTFTSNTGPYSATAVSDVDGTYEVVFDVPAGESHTFIGQTLDFCTGELLTATVDNSQSTATADFNLCSVIDPPPIDNECEAFFDYIQLDPAVLTVDFNDLSYSNLPINSWDWDLGDGTTATGPAVSHTYAAEGDYDVSLTIATDSCTSTIINTIHVGIDTTGCNCTFEYDPVCVMTATGQIQYPNACFAECDGFGPNDFVPCDTTGCVCPGFYDPVCVVDAAGDTLTFDNFCFAECEGYGPDDFISCGVVDCGCPTDYDPVCVDLGGFSLPFDNACLAICAGFDSTMFVVCDTTGCVCPGFVDPVCVIDPATGDTLTFQNFCYAECEGYTPNDFVPCGIVDCGCPTDYDPVCVDLGGISLPFDNECLAICAGFDSTMFVVCDTTGCVCPGFYDPVCVIDAAGDTLTFENFCYAECEGYTPDDFISCGIVDCGCPTDYDPVCVDLGGISLPFDNACLAICAGFDSTMLVVCDTTGCVCPGFVDPVCVIDPATGDTLTFQNFCYAECEGYTPNDFIPCGVTDCGCPTDYDPVCVETGGIPIPIPFDNMCLALCAGFDSSMIVVCDTFPPGLCWVEFDYDNTAASLLDVSFTALLSGNADSYLWDFGDGNTSTEANPTHTYAVEGIYDITLTVTYDDGCSATTYGHICIGGGGVINAPDCQAFFFFTQDDPANLSAFNFIDLSLGNDLEYSWDFGDGNSSTEQNPAHDYANAGDYTVTLTVSNDSCSSSYSMFVFTDPNGWYEDECKALFLPAFEQDSLKVAFLNLSSPDAVSFEWNFGDGEISSDPFPLHTYVAEGIYDVELTITTDVGCTNSFVMTIDLEDNDFTGNLNFNLTSTIDHQILEGVSLFPNPAGDFLNIRLKAKEATEGTLSIVDLSGRQLMASDQSINQGENTLKVELASLPSGIYFARLQTNNDVQSIKFVKN